MAWAEKLRSGRYAGRYLLPDGSYRSAGSFPRRADAQNAASSLEKAANMPGWRDPKAAARPWGDWAQEWWGTRNVDASTLHRDKSRLTKHLNPKWENVAIVDITRHEIKAWAVELRDSGQSAGSVKHIVHLLSSSLAAAVDAEIIGVNPALALKLPSPDASKERYLTRVESSKLLSEFEPASVDRALVSLLLGTGLRWGEALGLEAEHIDERRAIVRVSKAWDDKQKFLKDYPKSKRRRTVPLPGWVLSEIRPFFHEGQIFVTPTGSPLDYSNWRRQVWVPALKRAGIPHLTIHDLRHTYASWLIQDGISIAEVGRLLGHVSTMTTQRYAHLADIPMETVRAAISDPFGASRRESAGKLEVEPSVIELDEVRTKLRGA